MNPNAIRYYIRMPNGVTRTMHRTLPAAARSMKRACDWARFTGDPLPTLIRSDGQPLSLYELSAIGGTK